MANAIHIDNNQVLVRHQSNMMASLAHRLEIAKATNNVQLVELLEREKRQIIANAAQHEVSRGEWFRFLIQKVMNAFFGASELQVYQFANGSDLWWYAFDPQTGRCVYADSEAELRMWIATNYQGR